VKGAAWTPRSRTSRLERIVSVRHLRWLSVDWHVLLIAAGLLCTGVVFIHAMGQADQFFDRETVDAVGHLQKVVVALPALALGLFLRPRWLRRNAWLLYVVSIALLLLVTFIGAERNNARRWIPLPGLGFDLQPSELAKLGLILMLASVLYRRRLARLDEWVRPAALTLLPMGLVVLQPDLGTAMTLVPIGLGMLYLAGARARTLLAALALCGLSLVAAKEFGVLHDYQTQRIHTWLESYEPEHLIADKNGPAFHTYHARVAIGNGGFFGTGLGQGVANEAAHLPERDCDSIFAVIAEEGGFLGAALLLVAYALLVVLLLLGASQIRERFSRLTVGGIALYFAAHFFVNVGVNLGLVPMTGLTLPLVSTGGSSLLVTFLALGLALGLSAHQEPTLDQDAFRA
jgi:rod shape determining protein RodA